MKFIRRNAIALVALVLAMTGTGIAANNYLITSTNQIKPSVLRQLATPFSEGQVTGQLVTVPAGVPAHHVEIVEAQCPTYAHVVSGGYLVSLATGAYVRVSRPFGNGWQVIVEAEHASGVSTAQAYALCGLGRVEQVGLEGQYASQSQRARR